MIINSYGEHFVICFLSYFAYLITLGRYYFAVCNNIKVRVNKSLLSICYVDEDAIDVVSGDVLERFEWDKIQKIIFNKKTITMFFYDDFLKIKFFNMKYKNEILEAAKKYGYENLIVDNGYMYKK